MLSREEITRNHTGHEEESVGGVNGYGHHGLGDAARRWLKVSFISRNYMSVLTSMTFDLEQKTADADMNLAGIDILAISHKEAGLRGRDGAPTNK